MRIVEVGDIRIGGGGLTLIAGPCVIESEEEALAAAVRLKAICAGAGVPLIYKSSFDKANRSSIKSFRGPGREAGLAILRRVRDETGLPVLSDVHSAEDVEAAAPHLDILQIPAFLSRQTDLLAAAAKTGRPINVKKGQFLAPQDVPHIVEKIDAWGDGGVMMTERGTSHGYNDLLVDMRGLAQMREFAPVCFDATHASQYPSAGEGCSGGDRRFVAPLARAAVAAGVDALFVEVHPDIEAAPCDGPCQIDVATLDGLIGQVMAIDAALRGIPPVLPA